jgi:hypothetical protein
MMMQIIWLSCPFPVRKGKKRSLLNLAPNQISKRFANRAHMGALFNFAIGAYAIYSLGVPITTILSMIAMMAALMVWSLYTNVRRCHEPIKISFRITLTSLLFPARQDSIFTQSHARPSHTSH